jgi:CheY-like chemotaxis protein
MDELRLLEEIHHDPALSAIPVVLFSGTEGKQEHLVAAGLVAACLTTSVDRAQVMTLLEKLLRHP